MRFAKMLLFLGASSSFGCGTYTDEGKGTGTLSVIANLIYTVHDNTTSVDIAINKAGVRVDGATVAVRDDDTSITTTVPQHANGHYRYDLIGFHRKIRLTIAGGSDNLEGQIEGPGPHIISQPPASKILDLSIMGGDLNVKWNTDDGLIADQVDVVLDRGTFEDRITSDQGKTTIPKSQLLPSVGNNESVTVTRTNRVLLGGGIAGSTMTLAYRVTNSFVVQE